MAREERATRGSHVEQHRRSHGALHARGRATARGRRGLGGDRAIPRVPGAGAGATALPGPGVGRVLRDRPRVPAPRIVRARVHVEAGRRPAHGVRGRPDAGRAGLGGHLAVPAQGRPHVHAARAPRRRDGSRPGPGGAAMIVFAAPLKVLPLAIFAVVLAITLGITYWAARRTSTATEFWAAGRGITGFQNGWA